MRSADSLAEMLGGEFVQSATSGGEAYSDDVDGVTTEELGGPFVTSDASQEVSDDEPETEDGTREPFPLPHRTQQRSS